MRTLREEECSQGRNTFSVGGTLSGRHALREGTHCEEACSLGIHTLEKKHGLSEEEEAHSIRKGMPLWEKACSQWGDTLSGKRHALWKETHSRRKGCTLLGGGMLELQFIRRSSPSLHLLIYTGSRGWKSYIIPFSYIYIHPRFGWIYYPREDLQYR